MNEHELWRQASKSARAEWRGWTLAGFALAFAVAWLPQPWPVLGWAPVSLVLVAAVMSTRRHADALEGASEKESTRRPRAP